MSLPEVMVTMAILGILTMMAIAYFTGNIESAKHGVGGDTAALLNRAVNHYTQIAGTIQVDAESGGDDEQAVVELLQTRDTSLPGSPYVPLEMNYVTSSQTSSVRLIWTGEYFKILRIGESGTGLLVAP